MLLLFEKPELLRMLNSCFVTMLIYKYIIIYILKPLILIHLLAL